MSIGTLRDEIIAEYPVLQCIKGLSGAEVIEMVMTLAEQDPDFKEKLKARIREELISPSETL
jgi:hypothetical protein